MKSLNHGGLCKCLKIYRGLCLKRRLHNEHLGKTVDNVQYCSTDL
uniref:Uncharacterized protein n=1 Tax=Arundo donax TaxID=35708 RepID=A0A0A9ESG9_ARUDO